MSIRNPLLRYLEAHSGDFISGNELAALFGVSRAAIWKAIALLKEDGYQIKSVNKRGYQLVSDTLTPETICTYIADPAFWPDIHVYDKVTSTNILGKELAGSGAPSGTILVANQQTAGRGRLGRSFFAPPLSGLYMSVILRPAFSVEDSMLITSAAAVAVCRAIQATTGIATQIKWVNDIYYQGKKLCGILTEAGMNFESRTLDYVVIGIGVNISKSSFPPELCDVATSLGDICPELRLSRAALAGEIANQLQQITADLLERSFLREYRELSCVLGKRINVISFQKTEPGVAIDINENGNLIVKMDSGELRTISSGEVSIRAI